MWYAVLVAALVTYLLGNLNGAVCVSALMHDDVRSHGSGNAGLTNFIRNYGNARALYVVAIDAGKAFLACHTAGLILQPYGYGVEGMVLGGVCVMLGHDFPALLGFHGGKGILSGWFVAWAIDWRVALLIAVVFFGAYFLTRFVSMCSLLAAAAFGIGMVVFHIHEPWVIAGGVFMSLLTIFMHRANLIRLIKGKETKTHLFRAKRNHE